MLHQHDHVGVLRQVALLCPDKACPVVRATPAQHELQRLDVSTAVSGRHDSALTSIRQQHTVTIGSLVTALVGTNRSLIMLPMAVLNAVRHTMTSTSSSLLDGFHTFNMNTHISSSL